MRRLEYAAWLYRFGSAGSAFAVFLTMSWLYWRGDREAYIHILRLWGIVPFQTPFLDISFVLAAWDCARQGWDVMSVNPCDVLKLPFNYSPFWLTASGMPLGMRDTNGVGWALDILFIGSLSLLPAPQRIVELALVLTATFSTMVIFALERANADIILFMLALAIGLLANRGSATRMIGYGLVLLSALLKYYPIMALIVLFRERIGTFVAVALAAAALFALFWSSYHVEIARGLANVPSGPYNTNLFAAKNLPFLIGAAMEKSGEPSRFAAATRWAETIGLYAALVAVAIAICRRLLCCTELRAAIAALPDLERNLLVIGSAVVAGCFFAGQSVGYRGVFLLLVMPGLLALARSVVRELRALCLGSAIVIAFLMWGECLRLALHGGLGFWLLRELGWWWTISVMLAVLADFLADSPILRNASRWFRQRPVSSR